jgi:hypothetical protein
VHVYVCIYTCLWTFSSLSSSHFRCLYLISLTFVCTHFLGIKSFFFLGLLLFIFCPRMTLCEGWVDEQHTSHEEEDCRKYRTTYVVILC